MKQAEVITSKFPLENGLLARGDGEERKYHLCRPVSIISLKEVITGVNRLSKGNMFPKDNPEDSRIIRELTRFRRRFSARYRIWEGEMGRWRTQFFWELMRYTRNTMQKCGS